MPFLTCFRRGWVFRCQSVAVSMDLDGKVVVMSGTEMVGMYGIVMTRGAMGDAC